MKVIASGRQTGRTTQLIELAAADFLYIVCPDMQQVRYVADKAREMGADIPFPMTWDEVVRRGYYGRGINGMAIDNLDACIQSMVHVPIAAVTLEA